MSDGTSCRQWGADLHLHRSVVESTHGWYWAVDALLAEKCEVNLAHPYRIKAMRKRKRVKTDSRDAHELANLLRLGSLPEAYIVPPELRELRELVRHRRQLVKTATSVRNGIRGLLAEHGRRLPVSDLDAATGRGLLDLVELPETSRVRLASQRRVLMLQQRDRRPRGRTRPAAQAPPGYRICSASRASARCWRRCSSSGSTMSTASAHRRSWPAGPG